MLNLFSPFEASLQTPDRSSVIVIGISGGLPPDFPLIYRAVQICYLIVHTNLLMCIMFTFVISYVRTVLRVHSKYSPGLLIWPDVDEGDLMDEEFDSESDA